MRRIRYGIEEHEYQAMLEAQGGVCAICKQPESLVSKGVTCRLQVDHDHKTDVVRGLLCRRCNTILGQADDDPEVLRLAMEYLAR